MSDRSICIYCHREQPSTADWEANGELSSENEDEEAARLGLDRFCWEERSDDCTEHALETGRPTNLADALIALDAVSSR